MMQFFQKMKPIKCKKIVNSAILPYRTTSEAAGYDMSLCMEADDDLDLGDISYLSSNPANTLERITDLFNIDGCIKDASGVYIMPKKQVLLHTGICMEIPKGYCGLLMNRSSLSNLEYLSIADKVGLIDSDYRGEITLHMVNHSDDIKYLQNHTRICQIVIVPHISSQMIEAESLSYSTRGDKGYGSTGNKTWEDD